MSLVVSDSAPEISNVFGSTIATITEQVANPLVGFEDISIEASINDGMHNNTGELFNVPVVLLVAVNTNNVQLIVNRFGQVGTISVIWQAGTNQLVGVENGSIIPATGSIEMRPTDLTATIILTVRLSVIFTISRNCMHCYLCRLWQGFLMDNRKCLVSSYRLYPKYQGLQPGYAERLQYQLLSLME